MNERNIFRDEEEKIEDWLFIIIMIIMRILSSNFLTNDGSKLLSLSHTLSSLFLSHSLSRSYSPSLSLFLSQSLSLSFLSLSVYLSIFLSLYPFIYLSFSHLLALFLPLSLYQISISYTQTNFKTNLDLLKKSLFSYFLFL